jgi:ketosteroid isomerase-like protein
MGAPPAILSYFEAINNEDWDSLAEFWTDEAELRVVAARPRSGKEDVLGYYPRALKGYPKHFDDPYRISVAGDLVTVEIRFTGETAEGAPVEFEAVDVFDLRDGKLWKMSSWFDIEHVRRQIAKAPV